MEIHVVLAHELIEVDVLGVKPPLLVLGREIRCNANVAYRGFELQVIRKYIIMRDEIGPPKHL
jgi:hypothetical protein